MARSASRSRGALPRSRPRRARSAGASPYGDVTSVGTARTPAPPTSASLAGADGAPRRWPRATRRARRARPRRAARRRRQRQLRQRALAVDELGARRARRRRTRRPRARAPAASSASAPSPAGRRARPAARGRTCGARPRRTAPTDAAPSRTRSSDGRLDVRQPIAAALPAEARVEDLLGVAAQRREQLARLEQARARRSFCASAAAAGARSRARACCSRVMTPSRSSRSGSRSCAKVERAATGMPASK